MKKILLLCAAGMSTGILVQKMKKEAELQQIDVEIEAMAVEEAGEKINEKDVVLLGPQVRFKLKEVEKMVDGRIPVSIIDMRDYGAMNGKKVLMSALELTK